MPNFANPFQGNVNRKMTNAELMQAIRLDIAGELEAIYHYYRQEHKKDRYGGD